MTALAPPGQIVVGPHTYSVTMVPDGILSDAGRVGQTCAPSLSIAVCGDQRPSQVADTLLHECVHAILRVLDLDREIEESVALVLGPGLLALWSDNPLLVEYLTKITKGRTHA